MGYLFAVVPAVTDNFVSIPTNPGTQRGLDVIPFPIHKVFGIRLGLHVLEATLIETLLNHSGLSNAVIFSLFSFFPL